MTGRHMSVPSFVELPLHDATLVSVLTSWAQGRCCFRFQKFSERHQAVRPHELEFLGVTGLSLTLEGSWGPSSSVMRCEQIEGAYRIHMQSGDFINVVAREYAFAVI